MLIQNIIKSGLLCVQLWRHILLVYFSTENMKLILREEQNSYDACDLLGQNSELKVKIMGMSYVPDSGVTTHVILPFVFPFSSLGFNAMTYRKTKIS